MAKGQSYTRYQQGVINRYYEHADTRTLQKLAELVSDLYMCGSEPKAKRLWTSAEKALAQSGLKPDRIRRIVEGRDTAALAAAVTELTGKH